MAEVKPLCLLSFRHSGRGLILSVIPDEETALEKVKLCVVAHPVTSPVDKRSYPMIAITSMTRWSQKSLVLPFVPEQKVKKMSFSCLSTPGFVVLVLQSSDPLQVGCVTLVCSKLLRVAERKSEKRHQ